MYSISMISASSAEVSNKKIFHWIWHNAAPHRVQCFIRLVKLRKLKTGDFLLRIGILNHQHQALCKYCGEDIESLDHTLLNCVSIWNVGAKSWIGGVFNGYHLAL